MIDEEPQKRFAVAVHAADDFLLPLVPAVLVLKLVEHFLHLQGDFRRRLHALADRGAIAVARADDVADAILVPIDGELVDRGEPAALLPELAELLLARSVVSRAGAATRFTAPTGDHHWPSTSAYASRGSTKSSHRDVEHLQ